MRIGNPVEAKGEAMNGRPMEAKGDILRSLLPAAYGGVSALTVCNIICNSKFSNMFLQCSGMELSRNRIENAMQCNALSCVSTVFLWCLGMEHCRNPFENALQCNALHCSALHYMQECHGV